MLHVIYRSYGGENKKGRPRFYSKQVALGSLIRAFEQISAGTAELLFLNDGVIPTDRLRIMERTGEVICKAQMGNVGSLRLAFSIPETRCWAPEDLVWFAEDDYLYLPHALVDLIKAAETFPEADYFGLYALIGDRLPNGSHLENERIPSAWKPGEPRPINGTPWTKALSTTSTFGARVNTIAKDRTMMFAAMQCGGAFDHTKCLSYQGFTPFPLSYLMQALSDRGRTTGLPRAALVFLARAAFNAYAGARHLVSPSRTLIASDPALATHLEEAYLAQGMDWSAVATDTLAWMHRSGFSTTVGDSSPRSM